MSYRHRVLSSLRAHAGAGFTRLRRDALLVAPGYVGLRCRETARSRAGFTLVEMLLVLAIIGIMTAITLPRLGSALKGSRLRTASRSLVRAGRYARSMAVLQQREIELAMSIDGGEIAVAPVAGRRPDGEGEAGKTQDGSDNGEEIGFSESDSAPADPGAERNWDMHLKLERVRIASVAIGDAAEGVETGRCSVVYETNGRCIPYKVKLQDEGGRTLVVEVDALSSARTVGAEE